MRIPANEKLRYLEDMILPYTKKRKKKCFIEQYLSGAGNELSKKYWELKSSSRMAYDLYSWIKDDDSAIDFEFEFLLPGLASGGMGPNMDVYIETKNELIFIESKFTESANLHYIDNGVLRKAYYLNAKYGKKRMGLIERFNGNQWAMLFSRFCEEWESEMTRNNWHQGRDWFEPKQETCHLSGILLFLFDARNKDIIKNKRIRLYNIFWQLPSDSISEMEKCFLDKAQRLIDEILAIKNPGILDFKIEAFSVQEMLKDNKRLSECLVFPSKIKEGIIKRNESILSLEGIKKR